MRGKKKKWGDGVGDKVIFTKNPFYSGGGGGSVSKFIFTKKPNLNYYYYYYFFFFFGGGGGGGGREAGGWSKGIFLTKNPNTKNAYFRP